MASVATAAFPIDGVLGGNFFGCPLSSYLAIESLCDVMDLPPCATLTPAASWGAGCCGSLSAYGTSVGSCFVANAPACLDTSALASSIAGSPISGVADPCGAFAGGMGSGSKITPAGSASSAFSPATGIVIDTTSPSAKSGATAKVTSQATNSATSSSISTSGSTATTTPTAKNAGETVGARLKVYVGVVLIAALSVLSL